MNSILLTGSEGGVGTTVRRLLQARGWNVRSFDLASGQNLLDEEAVLELLRAVTPLSMPVPLPMT